MFKRMFHQLILIAVDVNDHTPRLITMHVGDLLDVSLLGAAETMISWATDNGHLHPGATLTAAQRFLHMQLRDCVTQALHQMEAGAGHGAQDSGPVLAREFERCNVYLQLIAVKPR